MSGQDNWQTDSQCEGTILAVGIDCDADAAPRGVRLVHSVREALQTLRLGHFDLLLIGTQACDVPVWTFVPRLRAARPAQRWALAAPVDAPAQLARQDEINARLNGVSAVFDDPPSWRDVLRLAASAASHSCNRASDIPRRSGATITEAKARHSHLTHTSHLAWPTPATRTFANIFQREGE